MAFFKSTSQQVNKSTSNHPDAKAIADDYFVCCAQSIEENKRKPKKQKKTFLAFALNKGPLDSLILFSFVFRPTALLCGDKPPVVAIKDTQSSISFVFQTALARKSH